MANLASRKSRGMASQRIVAEWFRTHGWPFSESTGAGRSGVDVTGVPGIAIEVKARRELDITGSLRQARSDARNGVPIVVIRPDGYGEARIHEWPCLIALEDLTELLHDAGYGSPDWVMDRES